MLEKFVLRAVGDASDDARILGELSTHVPNVEEATLRAILERYRTSPLGGELDPAYLGRGIGTALCKTSVQWARENAYRYVIAPGAPDGLFEFALWSGHLPWTTYAKLGFETRNQPKLGDDLPLWAQGDSPPDVMDQVRAVLDAGRPRHELNERLMVLRL
jgi:GNAT superfamily N-acetyltransferase